MNKNDGGVGTNNTGTITFAIENGTITSYNITGSGYACTIGGSSNAASCSMYGFSITSISWTPS